MKYPKSTGPGMLPNNLIAIVWRPTARDRSLSLTHLSVAIVDGIVTQKVRNIITKIITIKGMKKPQSLSHNSLTAEDCWSSIQEQLVKLLGPWPELQQSFFKDFKGGLWKGVIIERNFCLILDPWFLATFGVNNRQIYMAYCSFFV